jgi:hypothetical protein
MDGSVKKGRVTHPLVIETVVDYIIDLVTENGLPMPGPVCLTLPSPTSVILLSPDYHAIKTSDALEI